MYWSEERTKNKPSKETVIKMLKYFHDVGFIEKTMEIAPDVNSHMYRITSLNNHILIYPWYIMYDFSKFKVEEIYDDFGKYLLIRGKFSYSFVFSKKRTGIAGGNFNAGFVNCSKLVIFKKGDFNEKLFKKCHKDIIYSQNIDEYKYIVAGYPFKLPKRKGC